MKLRLLMNSDWRFAHRHELPSRRDILLALLLFTVFFSLAYIYHCWQWREEGIDADAQRTRILAACQSNGAISLGVTREKDGSIWKVGCQFISVKVGVADEKTIDKREKSG